MKEKSYRNNEKKIQSIAHQKDNKPLRGASLMPPPFSFSRPPVQRKRNKDLSEDVQTKMEDSLGHDFSNVKIHKNSGSAEKMNALAYAQGNEVHFASGQYDPSSQKGQELIGHEFAHVVQQREGRVKPTKQAKGLPINDDSALEKEADSIGTKAARGKIVKGIPLNKSINQPVQKKVIQGKFIASGNTAEFVTIANRILEVQYEIRTSATGEISIHSTSVQGSLTRDAQELLRTIQMVANDGNDINIEFIRGDSSVRASDRDVIVGNYSLSRIDLDDVEAFGYVSSHSRMGDNAAVQLVHEMTEQYRKQVHGEKFGSAHQAGYRAQERVLGANLINETPMTPIGGNLGEVTTTYQYPDGREVDVITQMDFSTGQIVSVNRNVRP